MSAAFRGVFTAIVTPFTKDGSIDWEAFERLLERQVTAGVAGVVPCGTTGESPTLSHAEQLKVIDQTVNQVKKRCLVVAGTGSNSTAHAVNLSREAEDLGVDACLVVNPYYNKPTQEGLFRHFRAVAQAVQVPVMVYNIKGRTAVNVETSTLLRLIETCRNITAVKEASGDFQQIESVINAVPDYFSVLSGDDNITLKLIQAGGDGVVSVASNLVPVEIVRMVQAALSGRTEEASTLNESLMPLFDGLFIETNPIPVKAALAAWKLCEEAYRLPMCEMSSGNRARLMQILPSKP